jgi:hypothetical protein
MMADVDVQCQFSGLIGILVPYRLSQGIPAPQRRPPLAPRTPSQSVPTRARHVRRRDRLGGLIHEYELAA